MLFLAALPIYLSGNATHHSILLHQDVRQEDLIKLVKFA